MHGSALTLSQHYILGPNEPRAPGAKSMHKGAQAALIACAASGKLLATRRGWYAAGGLHPRPINPRTVAMLCETGLISVRGFNNTRSARLTAAGKWYARTLCSAGNAGRRS